MILRGDSLPSDRITTLTSLPSLQDIHTCLHMNEPTQSKALVPRNHTSSYHHHYHQQPAAWIAVCQREVARLSCTKRKTAHRTSIGHEGVGDGGSAVRERQMYRTGGIQGGGGRVATYHHALDIDRAMLASIHPHRYHHHHHHHHHYCKLLLLLLPPPP